MKEENFEELKQQLEEYKAEKERVRKLVGQIGEKRVLNYTRYLIKYLFF